MEKGLSAAADGPFLWILWEGSLKALDREGHFLYNMPRLNPMDEGETAVEDWRGPVPPVHGFPERRGPFAGRRISGGSPPEAWASGPILIKE